MKCHDVPTKAMEGRSAWGRLGIKVFFQRYKLLESANFPFFTNGNAMAGIICLIALAVRNEHKTISTWLLVTSISFFLGLTFVFTAPTIGRVTFIRRTYLILVHYILLRFMESIEWCTGTNKTGYINHSTAHKIMDYGYVGTDEWESISSMAIVRNPYTRMISIYMYNRFGPLESFPHFIRSWFNMMTDYRETGEMEEWYTPCHCIPQFEYTHFAGRQLVQSIVKQEELKFLKYKEDEHLAVKQDSSVSDLPTPVRNALLGMPHDNKRVTDKKWWEYYDQETLNLTYQLYHHDFSVFQYSPLLEQRPDLKSPVSARVNPKVDQLLRNSKTKQKDRHSMVENSARVSSRRTSMRGMLSMLPDDFLNDEGKKDY
jgi:hypothetical protein